jgi:hypothetical protein
MKEVRHILLVADDVVEAYGLDLVNGIGHGSFLSVLTSSDRLFRRSRG